MAEKSIFAKYLFQPQPKTSADGAQTQLICSDDHDLMGFYFNSVWYHQPCLVQAESLALAYDELLCFVGQDLEHPADLGGELSITIAGQEYHTDQSCMILIPKYVPHGPIKINRVEKPFFSYTGGASRERVPVAKELWQMPAEVDFKNYVLHFNGIDRNESEFEVFRLHGEDNRMIGGFGGVFYGKFRWFLTTTPKNLLFSEQSHSHGQPEMLHFFSTDPADPVNLGAELTMHIMEESFPITTSTSVFIPANQPHTPLFINQVDRPFMFFTLMPDCQTYTLD